MNGLLVLLLAAWSGGVEFSETLNSVQYRAVVSEDAVAIYAVVKGKPQMVFFHPASAETPWLEESLTRNSFPDFFKDGSRALVYRMVNPKLGRSTLYVARFQKGRFARAGAFPEGRLNDLDGDGRSEIITQTAPLGRLLTVSCPRFETTVTSALKTDVMRWEGGRFVSAAEKFPAFFKARIAEGERALAEIDPGSLDRSGEYVGLALSLFYDYAAIGQARQGWRKLSTLVDPRSALPGVADCAVQIKSDLRAKLGIAADW